MSLIFSELNDAFGYVFSTFEKSHQFHSTKFDREFRLPNVIVDIAKLLGVLPMPDSTCLITGSKGKGSVARMVAWNIAVTGKKVGLVLTPEELGHLDRIRISNQSIPEADFCRILQSIKPILNRAVAEQGENFYFSPTGLFLLVGLVWFKEQNVEIYVIEGGRGIKYDEVGQLKAAVGVVTNIFSEHMGRLGPTESDVASDKLSLINQTETLVIGPDVIKWLYLLESNVHSKNITVAERMSAGFGIRPTWLNQLDAIANVAARQMTPLLAWKQYDTAAYFTVRGGVDDGGIKRGTICCDAAIHQDCIDVQFLQQSGFSNGAVLIGITADKNGDGILARLKDAGFKHYYVANLVSRVGHIDAWIPIDEMVKPVMSIEVTTGDFDVPISDICNLADKHGSLYIIGVQVFIRSVRCAFSVEIFDQGLIK